MNAKLDKIFSDVLKLDLAHVADQLTMAQVDGWDSLTHMDLIVEIEGQFGFMLNGDEIAEMVSIGAIRNIVAGKV